MGLWKEAFFILKRGDDWPTVTPQTTGRFNDPTQWIK
jgi:hypothetical protein